MYIIIFFLPYFAILISVFLLQLFADIFSSYLYVLCCVIKKSSHFTRPQILREQLMNPWRIDIFIIYPPLLYTTHHLELIIYNK